MRFRNLWLQDGLFLQSNHQLNRANSTQVSWPKTNRRTSSIKPIRRSLLIQITTLKQPITIKCMLLARKIETKSWSILQHQSKVLLCRSSKGIKSTMSMLMKRVCNLWIPKICNLNWVIYRKRAFSNCEIVKKLSKRPLYLKKVKKKAAVL